METGVDGGLAYVLGGKGVRLESRGLGGPDSKGGLLMLIGGNSPFGMGVVGSWGRFLGRAGGTARTGGRLMASGLVSDRGPPVDTFFLLGLWVDSSDLLLGLKPLPWPRVFLLSPPFA